MPSSLTCFSLPAPGAATALQALLLDAGLHEVGRGGVSTWSLANMALALLLEQEKAGCATGSAGHLLLGFLKYSGRVFDYTVFLLGGWWGGYEGFSTYTTALHWKP